MPPLELSHDDVLQLQAIANSRSMPHSLVQRAKIVWLVVLVKPIPRLPNNGRHGHDRREWRKRYLEFGIQGLHDDFVLADPGPMKTTRWLK